MTLVLDISEKKELLLRAKAQAQGLSAEKYAQQILDREL